MFYNTFYIVISIFFYISYIIHEFIVKFKRKHQKTFNEIYIYTHCQESFSQIKEYKKKMDKNRKLKKMLYF